MRNRHGVVLHLVLEVPMSLNAAQFVDHLALQAISEARPREEILESDARSFLA
jgi:hypothetical protein